MEGHSEKDLDTHDPVVALKAADDASKPKQAAEQPAAQQPKKEKPKTNVLLYHYEHNYKKLLIVPLLIFLFSLSALLYSHATTGEYFNKDISVKGGATYTILSDYDAQELESQLMQYTTEPISVRSLNTAGAAPGITVEAGIDDPAQVEQIHEQIAQITGVDVSKISVQVVGGAIGASFFESTIRAMFLAFIFMALVVFLYIRFVAGSWNILPSLFIVWSIMLNVVSTFAVISLLKVPVSTAGLAAFMLLIGYSVDTDILLTTRMLKSKQTKLFDRLWTASRTGIFMILTGMASIGVGLVVAQSSTIHEIMLILFIGLGFDIIYTWLGNAGVLRWYMERKIYVKQ